MKSNVERPIEELASFLGLHRDAITQGIIDRYVLEHPDSKAATLSQSDLVEWTHAELDELQDALRNGSVSPRERLLYAGDLVQGGSSLMTPLANYVETKLIVGKGVADFLWESYPGAIQHAQKLCEILEKVTLDIIRANLIHYANDTLTSGCLIRYWLPESSGTAPSAGSSRQSKDVDTLTRQEQRVLELAVQGKTNGEIASALDISQNTVRNHLARIYTKKNVSNRTELTKQHFERIANPR